MWAETKRGSCLDITCAKSTTPIVEVKLVELSETHARQIRNRLT